MKVDQMGGDYTTNRRAKKSYKILVGNADGKRTLGRPKFTW
jgi:hypothetical protein